MLYLLHYGNKAVIIKSVCSMVLIERSILLLWSQALVFWYPLLSRRILFLIVFLSLKQVWYYCNLANLCQNVKWIMNLDRFKSEASATLAHQQVQLSNHFSSMVTHLPWVYLIKSLKYESAEFRSQRKGKSEQGSMYFKCILSTSLIFCYLKAYYLVTTM